MPSLLLARDVTGDIKETLSSWDKCMAKTYCKWPVIVTIVVGSLVVLSIVICIARCICCGAECACCCLKCCSCCGSGRKGHKRMDSAAPPPAPVYPSNTPYQSHAPPTFAPAQPTPTYTPPAFAQTRTIPERPQFAQFDASGGKPVSDDALPPMPSWDEATSKKVEVEEIVEPEKPGDVEMNRLDYNQNVGGAGFGAMHAPGRRSPGKPPLRQSPSQDSYGFAGYQQNDSYASIPQHSARSTSPYGNQRGQQQEGYRGVSPLNTFTTPPAGVAPYAQNQQYGRSSPSLLHNQPYGQNQSRSHTSPVTDHGYIPPAGQAVEMPSPSIPEFAAGAGPVRSNSPAYAPSGSTRYEAPTSTSAYPGQQTYQAFQPAELDSGSWQGAPQRKPVNGSWKDL